MQEEVRKKELSKALGKVVERLRKQANLSSRTLAYEMGMSKTTFLLAEQGRLDPRISTFCKIAEAFYMKPDEFFSIVLKELPEWWFPAE